jgi:hypothetical protein
MFGLRSVFLMVAVLMALMALVTSVQIVRRRTLPPRAWHDPHSRN